MSLERISIGITAVNSSQPEAELAAHPEVLGVFAEAISLGEVESGSGVSAKR